MLEERKCKVEGCENSTLYKNYGHNGYCCKHYRQIQRYGKILERTKYDQNEIIDCGDYYEICLYKHKPHAEEVARTKIDKEDLEKVKGYKWSLMNKKGKKYIRSAKNKIYLHQLIMGEPPIGYEIDHKFGDTLDNRKSELRFVTHSQNIMNQKNSKGYSWDKRDKRWIAYIQINNKFIRLGYFIKEQDAIKVRKEAEQKYFGEYAYKKNE